MRPTMFRNVNDGFYEMVTKIRYGEVSTRECDTRNGRTIRLTQPFMWGFEHPEECVLMNKARDANPFFHLYEAIWMLSGRNDVDSVAYYCSRMRDFSDDGYVINDAYGYRWRNWFDCDQLHELMTLLLAEPNTRRAVLGMWDPNKDLDTAINGGKAVPCNTHCYFSVLDGSLDMLVCNRSNDLLWGAFGANAVHFSYLLQYVAAECRLNVGHQYHMSSDLHAYVEHFNADKWIDSYKGNPYHRDGWIPQPLSTSEDDWNAFQQDLYHILEDPCYEPVNSWMDGTFVKAMEAWTRHKSREYVEALYFANQIASPDWRAACIQWLEKRRNLWERDDK